MAVAMDGDRLAPDTIRPIPHPGAARRGERVERLPAGASDAGDVRVQGAELVLKARPEVSCVHHDDGSAAVTVPADCLLVIQERGRTRDVRCRAGDTVTVRGPTARVRAQFDSDEYSAVRLRIDVQQPVPEPAEAALVAGDLAAFERIVQTDIRSALMAIARRLVNPS